jgi:diguanylate cyclase (GGDEF)-like protein
MLAGADDYLAKPMRLAQLELRLIAGARVAALHEQLGFLTNDLRLAARRDPLTALGNRLQLTEDLATLADRVRRYGHRYALVLQDVDYFKGFNDRYGHQAGDAALTAVGAVLRSRGRAGDTAYRYGGEEFLCIFPEQSGRGALVAAQRTLQNVRDLGIPHEGSPHGVLTMSAGVAELTCAEADVELALAQADEALYQAKDSGRDQAVLSAPHAQAGFARRRASSE